MTDHLPDAEQGPRVIQMHSITIANGEKIGGYSGPVVPLEDYNKLREILVDLLSQIESCDGTAQLNIERAEAFVGSPSSASEKL